MDVQGYLYSKDDVRSPFENLLGRGGWGVGGSAADVENWREILRAEK
jgi:hypothetical protein